MLNYPKRYSVPVILVIGKTYPHDLDATLAGV